jgi:peptidoglycan/xylan/chitin deacetylase (PgdA/CDA1 family)
VKRFICFFVLNALVLSASFAVSNSNLSESSREGDRPDYSFKSFPVLVYHVIGRPEKRWTRTPENFRKDLEWLYRKGYYPMNLRDILTGFKGLPKRKIPVILTFDDSSSSQFRYLPDGTIDPECAVGMIKSFHEEHPAEWPMRATFFIQVQTNNPDRNIFGQPGSAQKKLRQLVEWGMEVGSHTYSHERLSNISSKEARYTLARSSKKLRDLSGREITSLATPMGLYPSEEAVFTGRYQKIEYDYQLVCEARGGFEPVPNSPNFKPWHIKRIQTTNKYWKKYFGRDT